MSATSWYKWSLTSKNVIMWVGMSIVPCLLTDQFLALMGYADLCDTWSYSVSCHVFVWPLACTTYGVSVLWHVETAYILGEVSGQAPLATSGIKVVAPRGGSTHGGDLA
jgi:hypothetical protein